MSSEPSIGLEPPVDLPPVEPPSSLGLGALTAVQAASSSDIPAGASHQRPAEPFEDQSTKEPEAKRQKLSFEAEYSAKEVVEHKLEDRLNGILCCVVCLDLPNMTIFQCTNGHLMCASCLWHLLADARLKDEPATCPSCRCEISKTQCVRNLAVEKAISELPCLCQFCSGPMPRHKLLHHEHVLCKERMVSCPYEMLGCDWKGKQRDQDGHIDSCEFPNKRGKDLVNSIGAVNDGANSKLKIYKSLLEIFSYERVSFADLQLRPYRTDDYIPKLVYETPRFTAFNIQWVVKARVNDNTTTGNPVNSVTRTISYQLVAKSKPTQAMKMMFMMLRGPFGDAAMDPTTYEHEFSGEILESQFYELPIDDATAVNRLVAAKLISIRLVLIHLPK